MEWAALALRPVLESLPIRSINADSSLLIKRIRIGLVETVVQQL